MYVILITKKETLFLHIYIELIIKDEIMIELGVTLEPEAVEYIHGHERERETEDFR